LHPITIPIRRVVKDTCNLTWIAHTEQGATITLAQHPHFKLNFWNCYGRLPLNTSINQHNIDALWWGIISKGGVWFCWLAILIWKFAIKCSKSGSKCHLLANFPLHWPYQFAKLRSQSFLYLGLFLTNFLCCDYNASFLKFPLRNDASKSSESCDKSHKTKARLGHNNEVDATITSSLHLLLFGGISPHGRLPINRSPKLSYRWKDQKWHFDKAIKIFGLGTSSIICDREWRTSKEPYKERLIAYCFQYMMKDMINNRRKKYLDGPMFKP